MFKTISNNVSAEIVEKKSKFIANLFYVETKEDAEKCINEIKKKYYDARHNCFAYSIFSEDGIINKFSDDGEPSGTAGAPMLNILNANNIVNVLVVVTRYFGGILLGTGGLVRAYSDATSEAIKKVDIIEKAYGLEVGFTVDYSEFEKIKYYFKQNNIKIVDTLYEQKIIVKVEITNEKLNKIIEKKSELNFNFEKYDIYEKKFIQIVK